MTHEEYIFLHQILANNVKRLREEVLTPEERAELSATNAQLSGTLMSVWVPFGTARRMIMATLVAIGLYGIVERDWQLLLAWVGAAALSPRLVGEVVFAFGSLARDFADGKMRPPRQRG